MKPSQSPWDLAIVSEMDFHTRSHRTTGRSPVTDVESDQAFMVGIAVLRFPIGVYQYAPQAVSSITNKFKFDHRGVV